MSRRGRLLWRTLVTLCVGVLGLVGSADPAGAGTWYYTQFNIWGQSFHQGGLQSANRVITYVGAAGQVGHGPAAVSLQEVCKSNGATSQFDHMRANLGVWGYYSLMGSTYVFDGNPLNPCHIYGPAMYTWGTGPHDTSLYSIYPLPKKNPSDPGEEPRFEGCQYVPLFAGAHTACSTHFKNSDVPWALVQMAYARDFETWYANNRPGYAHYMGGDFNACYRDVRTNTYTPYATRIEANGSPTWPSSGCNAVNGQPLYTISSRTSWTKKFDYSFVRATEFYGSDKVRWSYPSDSDHALLEGIFFAP